MNVKIFPCSDPIVLPMAPTIAGAIADYLQLLTQQVYVTSPHNYDNLATDSAPDGSWHWQCKSSIRLVTTSPYQYVSTIAHRLAAKSSFNLLEICRSFAQMGAKSAGGRWEIGDGTISAVTGQTSGMVLDCWYNEAGYIYFQVTAESIERWLNYIHDLPLNLQLNPNCRSADSMAIYAHARCCSILKLAAAEKLVTITDDWQIVTPRFAGDAGAVMSMAKFHYGSRQIDRTSAKNPSEAAANSRFEHPAEQRLIQVLMRVLDSIYAQSWEDSARRSDSDIRQIGIN
jgi:hypothetical protein